MKIVIIGLGSIGKTILKNLSGEGHTITIIDEDKNRIEKLIEKYDVLGVVGNGASMDIQNEANVADSDLVIALTRSDELNILACLVAKKVGAKNTIARVRNPDYRKQIAVQWMQRFLYLLAFQTLVRHHLHKEQYWFLFLCTESQFLSVHYPVPPVHHGWRCPCDPCAGTGHDLLDGRFCFR